jgi:transmembrane sensor
MQVQRQIDKLLAQRAAEWMEALKTGGAREHEEFSAWLRQSRLHVEHFLEAAAIDREIAALDRSQCPDVDELIARAAPDVVMLRSAATPPRPGGSRMWKARRWQLGAALAAGVALVALMFAHLGPGTSWRADRVKTATGEQRSLTLADGSVIALNTRTALRIDFSDQERSVVLESGEAVFKVAPSPSRPFVVRTPTALIRVLGTQFNVYQKPEGTTVSVVEGRVQVVQLPAKSVRKAESPMPVRELAAGQEALVAPSGTVEVRTPPDVHKALAWRQRRLDFDETPLEEIAQEFNRYGTTTQLRIEGIAPGTRRYGGVFDADDPESFAVVLERERDLRVERRGKDIVISRR